MRTGCFELDFLLDVLVLFRRLTEALDGPEEDSPSAPLAW